MFVPLFSQEPELKINEKTGVITISCNFGFSFKGQVRRTIGNEDKLKALFVKLGLMEIEFYSFFTFEIIELMKKIIKTKYPYNINIASIEKVIELLNNLTNREGDNFLNLKRVEDTMEFKIMKHQEPIFERYEFFKKNLNYRGMLIDAGPGTGKTFSSLALAEALNSDRVYIVCPLPTVKNVWENSLRGAGLVYKEQQDCMVLKDTTHYNGERFVIIHYEALEKAIDIFKDKNHGLNQITVIVDESHNLASSISKRTSLCLEFINMVKANDVFCLSGTPLKSSFKELGVIFSMIDSKFNGPVESRFYKLYKSPNQFLADILTKRYQGASVKIEKDSIELEQPITNYVNIKLKDGDKYTLKNIRVALRDFVNKRLKEIEDASEEIVTNYTTLVEKAYGNSGNNFPLSKRIWYEQSVHKIRENQKGCVFLFPELLKEVNDYENELASYLDGKDKKDFMEYKTLYKYPMLKIQGEALGLIITGARIQCHADMATALRYNTILNSTTKKTLIFSSYVNVCKSAELKAKKEGYSPIGVYGETVGDLVKNVKKFSEDKKINPLVTTYKALSTGVPLIAANVVICLDLPFRMYMYDQAISRVWRLGQDKQVFIYILSLDTGNEPNINSRNVDIITFFKEEIEKITGYKTSIELDKNLAPSLECYEMYMHGIYRPKKSNVDKFKIISW